jgi:branched-subunit amino acid ABC-type transport system permease component
MTQQPLLRVVWIYVKDYALVVISASLMYGGIHQIMSVVLTLIYPIARTVPLLVDAIAHTEFQHIPPLASYYSDVRMWVSLAKIVAVGVIAIVVGILVGLWVNSRSQRAPVPQN